MKTMKRWSALLLALMLLLSLGLSAHMEDAGDPDDSAQVTEEAQAEETDDPAEEPDTTDEPETDPVTERKPYATMPPVKKEDMPKPNADAKAEAIVLKEGGSSLFELPATESAVLDQLEPGSVLTLLLLGQTWCKVKTPGHEGYVPTQDLGFAFGDVQTGIAIVTAPGGKLTLRAEMSTKSKALGSVPSGRAALLLAKGDPFSLVRFEGKEGYVLTAHIKEVEPSATLGTYTKVVSLSETREANVRLRAEPKRNATEYTKVKSGLSLVVLEVKEDWSQVEYEGYHGWMMSDYLK